MNIDNFFDTKDLDRDRKNLKDWKKGNSLNSKIDKLLEEHLNTKECKLYNYTDKKMLKAFCEYLKKNLVGGNYEI